MAINDSITVVYKTGVGTSAETVTASKGGRSVSWETEKESGQQWIVVRETTRGGTEVRSSRFAAPEVVAILQSNDNPTTQDPT